VSEHVKEISDGEFADAIGNGVVLLDYWAPRCGPCRMQGSVLEEVAAAVGDRATLVKVNVDENPAASAAFDFRSIPTLILLKEGKAIRQFTGLQSKETLVSAIVQAVSESLARQREGNEFRVVG